MSATFYDVAIIGAGPAGSVCAAFCARAGLKTLIIERGRFPRPKVCGDCLNPSIWTIFQELDLADEVRRLPHCRLETVAFFDAGGRPKVVELPMDEAAPEIGLCRSRLDHLLLRNAEACGAVVMQGCPLQRIRPGWKLDVGADEFEARYLVAADGRNSSVARLLKLHPRTRNQRVAFQTKLSRPATFPNQVQLHILDHGYCGMAPVSDSELNVCLVGNYTELPRLKEWLASRLSDTTAAAWRTIVPLDRAPIRLRQDHLLFIGDAGRVVEPFTGEGIAYGMRTGALAAKYLARHFDSPTACGRAYRKSADQAYRGKLWINRLARLAVTRPTLAKAMIRFLPGLLPLLTRRVARAPSSTDTG